MVSVIAGLICGANFTSLALIVASQRRDALAPDPLVVESLANAQHLLTTAPPRIVFRVAEPRPAFAFARTTLPTPTS